MRSVKNTWKSLHEEHLSCPESSDTRPDHTTGWLRTFIVPPVPTLEGWQTQLVKWENRHPTHPHSMMRSFEKLGFLMRIQFTFQLILLSSHKTEFHKLQLCNTIYRTNSYTWVLEEMQKTSHQNPGSHSLQFPTTTSFNSVHSKILSVISRHF